MTLGIILLVVGTVLSIGSAAVMSRWHTGRRMPLWRVSAREVEQMQQSRRSRRGLVVALVAYFAALAVLVSASARLTGGTFDGSSFPVMVGVLAVLLWAPGVLAALVHNRRLPE